MMKRSPIIAYFNHIMASLERVAPERLDALKAEAITDLEFVEDPKFDVESFSETRTIRITTGALELLWTAALCIYVLPQEYGAAKALGLTQFDSSRSLRAAHALFLLRRAISQCKEKKVHPWPENIPFFPTITTAHPPEVQVANEIFLCAVAWILHHEYAHVRLGHLVQIGSSSTPQESAADLEATRWIFEKAPTESLQKRGLGLACAVVTLFRLEREFPNQGLFSHPDAMQRLHTCLAVTAIEKDSLVLFCAVVMLQIHSHELGHTVSTLDGDSFEDILGGLSVELARVDWKGLQQETR